ncbi:hypothetical protein O1L44_29890 [Streptomyces noursei]|uniref:hypothetical protein n=1 Tax=Streptomyces scabiei TaxID=1930 RepID=UPI0022BF63C2|nr:hypothetical protein [Streptomyces scabiei]MCZ0996359.1 hypothetical protein [Streptomyces noursei]MDX3028100.1 hypothetical protein [Streptomyces scabiei]
MHPNPYNNLLVKNSFTPAARTASANGTSVDRAQSGASFQDTMVAIAVGTVTDGTHTFEVQDSADNSSWAAVADAFLQGSEPAVTSANDETVYEIGYTGDKRYVRVITTVAGATTGGLYGATVILSNPRRAAVTH